MYLQPPGIFRGTKNRLFSTWNEIYATERGSACPSLAFLATINYVTEDLRAFISRYPSHLSSAQIIRIQTYGLSIYNMLFKNFIYHASWALPVANAAGKTDVPLFVTNKCGETIWPGLFTSNGTGPDSLGFELTTGSTRNLSVLSDWNGRIWGRTNCTFDDKGMGSCGTGSCGDKMECAATVSYIMDIERTLLMIDIRAKLPHSPNSTC